MMNKRDKLIARLKNKQYRDGFVAAHIKIGIPFQIRALREQRGWTQKELAERIGSNQAWIAQIENPNYSGFSLKTLSKLASIFDIGLIVRFVPFGNLVQWELELSPNSLKIDSFDQDPYFKETRQQEYVATYSQPELPIYTHIAQGGLISGGEAIIKVINPSQPLSLPEDEFTRYKQAKETRETPEKKEMIQKKLGNQMQQAMIGA